MEAGRDAVEWLRRDLQARDLAAVAVFETRLVIVQDFTNNVDDLEQAIGIAIRGQGTRDNWPSRQEADEASPSLLRHLPTGNELRRSTSDIYETLQVLARAAGEVQGRKILVFFGRGVGEMNDFGVWEPDSRYYGATIETLNDNNVAVYPLSVMPSGSRHTLEQSLQSLAGETGGIYHRQFTSFTTPLEMISDENGGYYLLSYQSRRSEGQSGFQRVQVTVGNPELTVRARQGYRYGDSPGPVPE
jgi:VWFA-related protein